MSSITIDGSDRQRKYHIEVDVDGKNKGDRARGKIIVIKDKSQRPKGKINGILIDVSGPNTRIKFPNQKFINPLLKILKREQAKFPWKGNHRQSEITTRIKLEDIEIEDLKNLIERTINYS